MAKTVAKKTSRRRRVEFPKHARLFAHHVVGTPPAPVVRKSADALTAGERDVFKRAITKAIADGTYSRLVQIHANMTHNMHTMTGMGGKSGSLRFLSWHRVYLIKFELAMRAFEPAFFVPHWRWAGATKLPAWLASFKPKGVVDNHGKAIPITRDAGGDPQTPKLPSVQAIQSSVMNQTDYYPFTLALEGAKPFGAHNQVHVWFHGTMSQVPTAPADPMFWLHHAEIDRIWAIWEQSTNGLGKRPALAGAKAVLDPWPETFNDVLDTGDGEYDYSYDRMTL